MPYTYILHLFYESYNTFSENTLNEVFNSRTISNEFQKTNVGIAW